MKKTVYVAAPWKDRANAELIAGIIERAGFNIARKWWLYEAGDEEHDKLAEQAQADFDAILESDVMLVLNSSISEGKAVEQGIALMNCIPIIGIGGPKNNIFHHLDDYTWVPDIGYAVEALKNAR